MTDEDVGGMGGREVKFRKKGGKGEAKGEKR